MDVGPATETDFQSDLMEASGKRFNSRNSIPNSGLTPSQNRWNFEQEETEVTEFFIFRSLFPLCAPVQNSCVQRCMAKREEMPVMEQKPGRYWGVISREHLPLGKRGQTSEVRDQISQFPNFSFQLLS